MGYAHGSVSDVVRKLLVVRKIVLFSDYLLCVKLKAFIFTLNYVGNMNQTMDIKMYESPKKNGIFTASVKVSSEITIS